MLLALLALLAAPTSPSLAPLTSGDSYPTSKGTMGAEFVLPGASVPTVGLTYFVANDMAARVDFGLNAVLSPSGTPAGFSLGVGLRMYQAKHDRVGVFLAPEIVFGRAAVTPGGPDFAEFLTFSAGVGVEYFFTNNFSAGGILALGLSLSNLGGPAGSSVITALTTGTSGLFATFYF